MEQCELLQCLHMQLCTTDAFSLTIHICCFAQLNNVGPSYLMQIDVVTEPKPYALFWPLFRHNDRMLCVIAQELLRTAHTPP